MSPQVLDMVFVKCNCGTEMFWVAQSEAGRKWTCSKPDCATANLISGRELNDELKKGPKGDSGDPAP